MLYSSKGRFFLDCKQKDQICLCFDAGLIESADGSEDCLYVARIVADSRRVNFPIPNLRFDLQSFLKNRVKVRIKDNRFCATGAFSDCDEIALAIVRDLVELARLECLANG